MNDKNDSRDLQDNEPELDADDEQSPQNAGSLSPAECLKLLMSLCGPSAVTAFLSDLKGEVPVAVGEWFWILKLLVWLLWVFIILYVYRTQFKSPKKPNHKPQPRLRWWEISLLVSTIAAFTGIIVLRLVIDKSDLNYVEDEFVSVAAGSVSEGEPTDGLYHECILQRPGDLSYHKGKLYFVDGGAIRVLEEGEVTTLNDFPNNRLGKFDRMALALQIWKNDLFVLSGPWLDTGANEWKVSLIRLRNASPGDCEEICNWEYNINESGIAIVSDFAVNGDGVYYVRIPEEGVATPCLEKIPYSASSDTYDATSSVTVLYFSHYKAEDMAVSRLVFGERGELFVSVPGQGLILRVPPKGKEATPFAGQSGVLVRSDAPAPTFKMPVFMAWDDNGFLYVQDFGVIRRISVQDGAAVRCETLGGYPPEKADPNDANYEKVGDKIPAQYYRFSPYPDSALAVGDGGEVFVSDPELGFLYTVAKES